MQVAGPVWCLALKLNRWAQGRHLGYLLEFDDQLLNIQWMVHGIPGSGMGQLKLKKLRCGEADARPAKADAGWGVLAQTSPGVVNDGREL